MPAENQRSRLTLEDLRGGGERRRRRHVGDVYRPGILADPAVLIFDLPGDGDDTAIVVAHLPTFVLLKGPTPAPTVKGKLETGLID